MFAASKSARSGVANDNKFNYVTMLLNGDGTNGAQNNTFLNSPPKGVGSYTGYFSGSAQYLTWTGTALGSGNFTIECWVYTPAVAASNKSMLSSTSPNTTAGFAFYLKNGTTPSFYNNAADAVTSSVTLPSNQWNHVAAVRSGTTLTLYLNGVSVGSGTFTSNLTSNSFYVASDVYSQHINAYISNVRHVVGTAVYTSAFTPPTAPLTAISGTSILTCQSATFVDNSTNAYTLTNTGTATIVNPNTVPAITRNGTPTQGSFSPYGDLWSNYFNGSTDYLTVPANAAFNFGTGDFTVEAWVYIAANSALDGLSRREALIFALNTDTFVFTIDGNSSTTGTGLSIYNGTSSIAVTGTISQNAWNHIAVSRSGSSAYFWLNGVQMGTTQSITGSWGSSTQTAFIGQRTSPSYTFPLNGYVSNLRVVKGTALYTSAFTPSTTPLTAITNTQLLTCQSNRFRDASSNNFTVTVNGSPSVQRFSPFEPSTSYTPAVNGGSGYFKGSSDSLTVTSNVANFGTGDFTVEAWVYLTGSGGGYPQLISAKNAVGPQFGFVGTTQVSFYDGTTSYTYSTGSSANQWAHVAFVRSSGTFKIYVNGTQVGSFTYTGAINLNSTMVGAYNNGAANGYFQGYISDLRTVNGTAIYTAAFIPSTAPLTAVTNTSFLESFTNAGISDAAAANDLTTVGNAQVSTSVVKYGTGSIYLNGSASGLQAITNQSTQFGAGNFTLEFWVYFNSTTGAMQAVNTSTTSTTNLAFALYKPAGTTLQYFLSSTGTTWDIASGVTVGTVTASAWYHVALVRNGSTFTPYLNGVAGTTTTSSAALFAATRIGIGNQSDSPTGASDILNGYIDDLRITKGYARYTANFTPPTAALPTF